MLNSICPQCSSPAAMGAGFCRSCGLRLSNSKFSDQPNSFLRAALILLAVGVIVSVAFWLGMNRAQQPIGVASDHRGTSQTSLTALEPARKNVPSSQMAKKRDRASLLNTSKGSALRTELLDVLRPLAEREFGGRIVFAVDKIRSDGEFAFVIFRPVRSNGTSISMSLAGGMGDAYGEALLSRQADGWKVDQIRTGSSDVWWCEFRESYPPLILGDDCSW